MVWVGWYGFLEEVRVYDSNLPCFSIHSSSSPVRPDAILPHDALDALAIAGKLDCNTSRAIGRMVSQHLLNTCFECPIFMVFPAHKVERLPCDAEGTGKPRLAHPRRIVPQFFFWSAESLSVSSPTSSKSSLFCF